MAQWIVEAADRETGEDRRLYVEAPGAAEAREAARAKGLVVSAVYPAEAGRGSDATPPEAMLEYARGGSGRGEGQAARALTRAAWAAQAIGWAYYALAILAGASAAYGMATARGGVNAFSVPAVGSAMLGTALWGVGLHATAALLLVVRDRWAGGPPR
jgi:hypothetical protein